MPSPIARAGMPLVRNGTPFAGEAGDPCCCGPGMSCYVPSTPMTFCEEQDTPVLQNPPGEALLSWSVGSINGGCFIMPSGRSALLRNLPSSGEICMPFELSGGNYRFRTSISAAPTHTDFGQVFSNTVCTGAVFNTFQLLQFISLQQGVNVGLQITVQSSSGALNARLFEDLVTVANPHDCYNTQNYSNDFTSFLGFGAAPTTFGGNHAIAGTGGSGTIEPCGCEEEEEGI